MRKDSNFKKGIGRRAAAAAMAALMLGSFTVTGSLGGETSVISANAAAKTFTYTGNNISKFKGEKTITISKNLSGKALASLAKAYKSRTSQFLKVKTVKFGDKVTKVSAKTFLYFPNVTKVSIGKKVAELPESSGFTVQNEETLINLKKFTVSSKNADFSAKDGVLYNKKKTRILKVPAKYGKAAYVMPSTVESFASEYALYRCDKITSVTLSKAFDGSTDGLATLPKLKTINVAAGNGDYQVDNGVLYNKDKTKLICWPQGNQVQSAVFPDSLKSMNTDVLPKSLTSITIPKGLTQLYSDDKDDDTNPSRYPLNALPKLKEVKVADGNSKFSVEDNVLYNSKKTVCYGIPMKTTTTSIKLADPLLKGYIALFYGHTTITDLTFGKAFVDSLGNSYVFTGNNTLTSLKSITVSEENEKYKTENGVLYSKDMTQLLAYPMAKPDKEYVIPDSVKTIVTGAFGNYNKTLIKLTIGAALDTSYGLQLPALQEYAINDENDTFTVRDGVLYNKNMTVLCGYPYDKKDKEYAIPSGIIRLDYYTAFANKNLKSLIIQSDIYDNEEYMDFEENEDECWTLNENLPKLEKIKAQGSAPFKTENGVLFSKDKTKMYCYPANKDASTYTIPDSVKVIYPGAMSNLNHLKTIHFGKKMQSVYSAYNFYDAPKLSKVTVSKGNKYYKVKSGVLYNKKMTELILYPRAKKGSSYTLPKTIQSIECSNESFYKSKTIKKLKVANGNKKFHVVGKTIVRNSDDHFELSLNIDLSLPYYADFDDED